MLDNGNTAVLKGFAISLQKNEFFSEWRVQLTLDYSLSVGENKYIPKSLVLTLPLRDVSRLVDDLQTVLNRASQDLPP